MEGLLGQGSAGAAPMGPAAAAFAAGDEPDQDPGLEGASNDLPEPVPFPSQKDSGGPFLKFKDREFKTKDDLVAYLAEAEAKGAQPAAGAQPPPDIDARIANALQAHTDSLLSEFERRYGPGGGQTQRQPAGQQPPGAPQRRTKIEMPADLDPDTQPAKWAEEMVRQSQEILEGKYQDAIEALTGRVDETQYQFQTRQFLSDYTTGFAREAKRVGVDPELSQTLEEICSWHPSIQSDLRALPKVVENVYRTIQSIVDKRLAAAKKEQQEKAAGKTPSVLRTGGPGVRSGGASTVPKEGLGRLDGPYSAANRLAHAFAASRGQATE